MDERKKEDRAGGMKIRIKKKREDGAGKGGRVGNGVNDKPAALPQRSSFFLRSLKDNRQTSSAGRLGFSVRLAHLSVGCSLVWFFLFVFFFFYPHFISLRSASQCVSSGMFARDNGNRGSMRNKVKTKNQKTNEKQRSQRHRETT